MAHLRDQLVRQLKKLGVEDRPLPGRDDGFSSLIYDGKEFAHFHDDKELDIRLTKNIINREGLVHPADSRVHPNRSRNSQWIEVRFSKPADLERIVRLVKLAIEQI
jgi:hypothetical protein